MATPVALLMIGGEFDLSAGVAVTSSALTASLFCYEFTTNVWVGVAVALVVALLIGFLNGWIVVRPGIPSFLVTLGTFFMLQGLNLALTQTITNRWPARTSRTSRASDCREGGLLVQRSPSAA